MVLQVDLFDVFLSDKKALGILKPYTRKKKRDKSDPPERIIRVHPGCSVFKARKGRIDSLAVAPVLGMDDLELILRLEADAEVVPSVVGIRTRDSLVLLLEAYTSFIERLMKEKLEAGLI